MNGDAQGCREGQGQIAQGPQASRGFIIPGPPRECRVPGAKEEDEAPCERGEQKTLWLELYYRRLLLVYFMRPSTFKNLVL